MDVVGRIRRLLGTESTHKRKHIDEDSTIDLFKKYKSASYSRYSTNNFDDNKIADISRMKASVNRNFEPYPYQSQDSKMGLNYGNSQSRKYSAKGDSDYNIASMIENDYNDDIPIPKESFSEVNCQSTPITNGTRKLPGLIKTSFSSFHKPGSCSFPRPQQTVQPHYGQRKQRDQFSNIPELYPIGRQFAGAMDPYTNRNSLVNGSSYHSQTVSSNLSLRNNLQSNQDYPHSGRTSQTNVVPAFNDFSSAKRFFSSKIGLKSFTQKSKPSLPKSEVHTERRNYANLLDLVPGLNLLRKTKTILPSKTTNNREQETIDLSNEHEGDLSRKSSLSGPIVEPVNTLRARFETKPVFKDNYVDELNKEFSKKRLSRSESIKVEKEISTIAEQKRSEVEGKYLDSFNRLTIDSSFLYDEDKKEEEPANDYPPLDEEKQRQIFKSISGRDAGTILNTKFSLSITKADIQTLNWNPLTWLNDEVINFYMELLAERSKLDDSLPKVHGMNTFFLKRLLDAGYSGVRRWTRKVDIFAYDVLVIPVHKGIHWCMSIIHFKNKTIKYYDSMGAPDNQVLNALAEYLKEESLDKKKVAFDFSGWTVENVQGIPQQENGSDCGVFSCMYAEFITRNRPIVFTQQHMQYFRMKMVYEICTGKMLN